MPARSSAPEMAGRLSSAGRDPLPGRCSSAPGPPRAAVLLLHGPGPMRCLERAARVRAAGHGLGVCCWRCYPSAAPPRHAPPRHTRIIPSRAPTRRGCAALWRRGSALPVTVSASAAGIHHHGRHGHHDTRASFHHAPPRAVEAPPYGGADPRAPRAPVFLNARARRYCARVARTSRALGAQEMASFYIFLFNFIHPPADPARARARAREQFMAPA